MRKFSEKGRQRLEQLAVLEPVREGEASLRVRGLPACAHLRQHRARFDVAAVGFLCPSSSPGSRLGSPPWHPPRPISRYHCSPAPWRAGAEGRRGVRIGDRGGGRKRPRPWCRTEEGGAPAQPQVGGSGAFLPLRESPKPTRCARRFTFVEVGFLPLLNRTGQSFEREAQTLQSL